MNTYWVAGYFHTRCHVEGETVCQPACAPVRGVRERSCADDTSVGADNSPEAIILPPRGVDLSHCSLVPVMPGCLLELHCPLVAIVVLSGFVPSSRPAFRAALHTRS